MIQSSAKHASRKTVLSTYRTRSLLEATRKVIADGGFDAVTMERVSAEAGLTKGAVYLYFPNKEQLILAAVEEIFSDMVERIESQVDAEAGAWERLVQTLRAQLTIMEEQRDLIRVLLLDRRLFRDSPGGHQARRLFKYRDRHEERLKQCLDEGVKKKTFRAMDTSQAAFYINEMAVSTAWRRMIGRSPQTLERDIEQMVAFIALLVHKHARHAAG
ncbi:MAG TPA: TetR/AcrR family transcriptional regulator [Candidatus Binatia bacterium]|jgi:AcrR family transcriptional regulator